MSEQIVCDICKAIIKGKRFRYELYDTDGILSEGDACELCARVLKKSIDFQKAQRSPK